jgi:hypothetical protein
MARGNDGSLVAVGSFNEGEEVVLWAGVSPVDHPRITITEETADGDAGSSVGGRSSAAPSPTAEAAQRGHRRVPPFSEWTMPRTSCRRSVGSNHRSPT